MPDKCYKPRCGRSCLRCWQNKLKHANGNRPKRRADKQLQHQQKGTVRQILRLDTTVETKRKLIRELDTLIRLNPKYNITPWFVRVNSLNQTNGARIKSIIK